MAFLALPAHAQAYPSDLDAALAAGSARLKLFALQTVRPDGAGEFVGQLQRHLGLAHIAGPGPGYISHSISVAPVLDYDSNINAGTPGETIKLGSFLFKLSDASRAKAGLVAGLAPSANLRFSLGQGRVIEASASASTARALDYDLTRQNYAVRICGEHYLGAQSLSGADWLDICAGRRGGRRALSNSDEVHASLGWARQYASAHGFHEVSARIERVDNGAFAKSSFDFGVAHAAALGVVDWRIELGEKIAGQHTRLGGVTLSLTRPIFGAQSTIFLTAAHEGGADFFGTPRWDEAFRIGFGRAITPKASVTLSLENRRSTLENYSGTTIGFSVNIALSPLSGG